VCHARLVSLSRSTVAEGFAMIIDVEQQLQSTVPSIKEIRVRSGARPATPEEFAAFEAKYGPFLPPDEANLEKHASH